MSFRLDRKAAFLPLRALLMALSHTRMRGVRDTSPAGDAAPVKPARVHLAGRNDPCPCGSARKFKACCRGKQK